MLLLVRGAPYKGSGIRPARGSHLHEVLQLAGLHAEAVQLAILAQAEDPVAARRHPGRHKVAALALPRLERLHHLPPNNLSRVKP